MVWPRSIAPFEAVITVVRPDDPEQLEAAQGYYQALLQQGVDCLLDDRDERPGVKFKDAELIGVPARITVGRKFSQGLVELYCRHDNSTRELPIDSAVQETRALLEAYPL